MLTGLSQFIPREIENLKREASDLFSGKFIDLTSSPFCIKLSVYVHTIKRSQKVYNGDDKEESYVVFAAMFSFQGFPLEDILR